MVKSFPCNDIPSRLLTTVFFLLRKKHSNRSPYGFYGCLGFIAAVVSVSVGSRKKNNVLHFHLTPCVWWVFIFTPIIITLRRLYNLKIIYTEHNAHNLRREMIVGRTLDVVTYRLCDTIVCISNGVQQELTKYVKATKSKSIVIPNSISDHFFSPICPSSKNINSVKFVTFGRLVPQKRIELILEAFSRIPQDLQWEYIICGEGPEAQRLNDIIAQDDVLKNKVTLLPFIERREIGDFLDDCHCYINFSRHEGFGLAAAEALSRGLRCIVPELPGIAEVVGGTDSILVKASSVDDITTAIKEVARNPLIDIAYRKARQKKVLQFSLSKQTSRLAALYLYNKR